MNQVDKKYVILGSLCALVLMLAVGYAAFNAVLNIKGTTNISSNWDVKITGITLDSSKGATDNEGSPSYDNTNGLEATFNTNFTTPGDYATYKIEITNNGSMDATLKNITMPENTNNDIIFYLNKDQNNTDIANTLKQNDTLFKKGETGNVGYVYVTVLYRDYANQQTAQIKNQTMTITFDFEQKTNGEIASDYTRVLYSKNVLTNTDDWVEEEWVANSINLGDLVDKIKGYAKEDSSTLGNYYLKHEVVDDKITISYVCFVTDTEHCMRGGSADYYETNKDLLQSQESWFTANGGSCYFHDSISDCHADLLEVSADFYGIVNAGADAGVDYKVCTIDANVRAYCRAF